jgi:hypothetical protein
MAGEAAQPDGVAHQQVVHGAEDGAEVGFAVGHQFRMGQLRCRRVHLLVHAGVVLRQ